MQEYRTINELRAWRQGIPGSLGLVPTMGALHDGHLELIRTARQQNNYVAVSIFVNPRQFGDGNDFSKYPRTIERDLALLRAESVDAVFLPAVDEMYPAGAVTRVVVDNLSQRLEGDARPGHFDGVCTIVCKLFNVFQPDRAYFGQKDAQQLIVIRKMVNDLNLPIDIIGVDTVRDNDDLALSSRNVHLSEEKREAARAIPRALSAAAERFLQGERSADWLRSTVRDHLERQEMLQVDYVSLADSVNLEELDVVDRPAVLSVAVECGTVRLIDNLTLTP